jgi:hypothetical protein
MGHRSEWGKSQGETVMAIFEVQGPDGKTYEVEAPSMEAAAEAIGSFGPMPAGGSTVDPAAVDDFKARGLTALANTAQGMSFGFGENAVGAKAGIESMLAGGEYLPAYRAKRDDVRADMATVNEKYPTAAGGGQATGMAINALATAPLAMGKGLLQTMGYGAGFGAAEGALQGAGNADGGDIVGETMKGGLIGMGAGMAAPAIVGGLAMGKNLLTEGLPSMFGKASQSKANRAIATALQRSGKSLPDIDDALKLAVRAGQPEFRVMDAMGLPGQRAASGIVRGGSQPGDEVAEFLATRQAGQPERVGAFVEEAFDVGGTTAAKTKAGLDRLATNANSVAYTAARGNAGPVNLTPTIESIDNLTMRDPILGETAFKATEIGNRLAKIRAQMATGNQQLIDFNQVLNIKQDLGGIIDGIKRTGNKVPPELAKVYGELDQALEGASDMYRAANDGARASFKAIDAVDEGAFMATRGRAADNVPKFGAMAAAEQNSARVGYGDRLLEKLENVTSPTSNRAKALQSPKRVDEAAAMATDAPLYADRLGRENIMWETQNRALGGSRTADNLADVDAMNDLAGGAMGAARSASNLQVGDAVAKVAGMLSPILKGQNEATRKLIAEALLSGNANVLAPVVRQAGRSSAVRRVLEAIIRQPMREGGEGLVQ